MSTPPVPTDRTVFLHSLEGPVLLPLDANIEPVAAAVEIFSHLSDGGSVGVGDLADVGKLHPDNQFFNNKSLSDVIEMWTWILESCNVSASKPLRWRGLFLVLFSPEFSPSA